MPNLNQTESTVNFNVVVAGTLFILSILIGGLYYLLQNDKPIRNYSTFYYLEKDYEGTKDRIQKTTKNGNQIETVYENNLIQDFNVNDKYLLVSEGSPNQQSQGLLINRTNYDEKTKIDFGNNYLSYIIPNQEKFLVVSEEVNNYDNTRNYAGKLFELETDKPLIEVNPQGLAKNVSSVIYNKSKSLLVFVGFDNRRYVLNMLDYNQISRLETFYGFFSGFINDTSVLVGQYSSNQLNILNLVNLEKIDYPQPEKDKNIYLYLDAVSSKDLKTVFYTSKEQSDINALGIVKTLDSKDEITVKNYSLEGLKISRDEKTLFIKAYSKIEKLKTAKDYSYSPRATQFIYDINSKRIVQQIDNANTLIVP